MLILDKIRQYWLFFFLPTYLPFFLVRFDPWCKIDMLSRNVDNNPLINDWYFPEVRRFQLRSAKSPKCRSEVTKQKHYEGRMLRIWVDTLLVRCNVCPSSFSRSVTVTDKTSECVTWVPLHRSLSLTYAHLSHATYVRTDCWHDAALLFCSQ